MFNISFDCILVSLYFEYNKHFPGDSGSDEDDFLFVKQRDHNLEVSSDEGESVQVKSNKQKKALTKAAVAKKLLKKKILPNQKILFSETGEVRKRMCMCVYVLR